MIQDIEKIKKEIKNHIEIDITYPIIPGINVKYITLNDEDEESFYLGGEYIKSGYEKIFLRKGINTWAVKSKIRDDNNDTIYNSRFFINKEDLKIKENNNKKIQKEEELNKVIKSQQNVIDKLSKEVIKYQKTINTLNIQLQNYKNN